MASSFAAAARNDFLAVLYGAHIWLSGYLARCVSMPGCIQARQFIGQEDPTQEPLHFVLQMNGIGADQKHGIPWLPTGNLVSGQPAAIMSYCQVQSRVARVATCFN